MGVTVTLGQENAGGDHVWGGDGHRDRWPPPRAIQAEVDNLHARWTALTQARRLRPAPWNTVTHRQETNRSNVHSTDVADTCLVRRTIVPYNPPSACFGVLALDVGNRPSSMDSRAAFERTRLTGRKKIS